MIPGGLLTALGGFFAYSNPAINILTVIISGWIGMLSTLLLSYYLGSKTGMRIAKKLKQEKIAHRAEILLTKHGPIILTTSLLANLTRFWISYVAGTKRYDFKKFFIYAASASLVWSSLLVFAGYLAGTNKDRLESGLARLGIIAWVLLIVATGVIYWKSRQEYEEIQEQN